MDNETQDVGTMDDFIVNPEGNFASDWRDSLSDDVKGSFEGINNFNDMVSSIHSSKSTPTTINGIADDKGNLQENWQDQFEGLKDNPSMKNFKSVEGLAKSLVNANKMVGKKLAPGEFLSDEHKSEFYKSLGVPENIEGYDRAKPDGLPENAPYNQDNVDWFANKALEYNLTPEQFTGIRNDFQQLSINAIESGNQEINNELDQERNTLKTEWGEAYDSNIGIAKLALSKVEGGEIAEELGLDNNPRFAKFMYHLAQTMGEDTLVSVGSGGNAMSVDDAKGKIAELQAHKGYLDPSHPEHANIHRKITSHFKMLHPE